MTDSIKSATEQLSRFRDERDWGQFHGVKSLIVALNIEAAELLELTQWKSDNLCEELLKDESYRKNLEAECADVFSYLLLLCDHCQIDILRSMQEKLLLNEKRYPVARAKGSSKKYSDL